MTELAAPPTIDHAASVTRVEVARPHDGGRVRVRMSASGPVDRPVIRPVLVSSDGRQAKVSLVPEGALLLSGDHVHLDIRVEPGASLELIEPAGTVAYPTSGGLARWDVHIALAPAATLIWAGEPFVVAEGASVVRRTSVSMGWGARLALREVLVLGRHDEGPGSIRAVLDVTGANGVPVLCESLDLGPGACRLLTGEARAIATVLLLGDRLPDCAEGTRLDLEAEGTLVRGLADAAHRTLGGGTWAMARGLAGR